MECPGVDNAELCDWIYKNLDFDQMILEYYKPGEPNSGWCHCSYIVDKPRKQFLLAYRDENGKTKYKPSTWKGKRFSIKIMTIKKKTLMETIMLSNQIDTVMGTCSECEEDTVLVAIVSDYYRCTNCGFDNRQHVNGKISYLKLTESDKTYLRAVAKLDNGKEV